MIDGKLLIFFLHMQIYKNGENNVILVGGEIL
jgi:hypothetical protein